MCVDDIGIVGKGAHCTWNEMFAVQDLITADEAKLVGQVGQWQKAAEAFKQNLVGFMRYSRNADKGEKLVL